MNAEQREIDNLVKNTTNNDDLIKYGYDKVADYDGSECPELSIYYGDKTNRIEQVIKALGTMVLIPTETSDPNNIGQKVYGQPVQRPILEGVNRDKVLNKLVELIIE